MNEDEWDSSSFITAGGAVPEKGNGTPIFRKEFAADKDIVSAVLYSTALGNYDVFINGERVGELLDDGTTVYDELKPGYTDMGLRVQYQSYDVTHLLDSNGQNTLSAIVTNGWWNNVVNGSVWGGSDDIVIHSASGQVLTSIEEVSGRIYPRARRFSRNSADGVFVCAENRAFAG